MNIFQADIDAIGSIAAVPTMLEVICRTTGMGFSAIARVTEDNWVACAVRDEIAFGLKPGGELQVATTICNEIRQSGVGVVIDHVAEDPEYCQHHTPAMYGIQSYISLPIIRKDGTFFGTLCAIDPRPARVKTPEIIGMFKLYAELIAFHLQAIEQMEAAHAKLLEERRLSELREQFIAILGHDLRNPVAAASGSAQLLLRMPLDEKVHRIAQIIKDSTFRMKGLVDNVMDFAHGRLGGGIVLNRSTKNDVAVTLKQVISELATAWPDRIIETEIDLPQPVDCDTQRIAQLFSNLLSNALSHGSAEAPVRVQAKITGGEFVLIVSNAGAKIPTAVQERLFQPFMRGGDDRPGQQGLGLGLYIASEIAKAHGGTLHLISTHEETSFILQVPQ